ncbi:MAG: hypothetical protein HW388_1663, partial [Dehalococcoidia bacterium]|nr:hypothetical protein [Dehalococcoidia bacterium]
LDLPGDFPLTDLATNLGLVLRDVRR